MFLSEWREFRSAHCLAGVGGLDVRRVSMLLKSRASLTCFRACFLPGRAKDTYQNPGTMTGDSLVDIVTGQQAGPSCLLCWQRQEIFVFSRTSTQPLVQQLHPALNLGVKLPDRETDQSPPSSAQKTLPNVTKTWCSIKHGDEFQLQKFLLKFEWALCY